MFPNILPARLLTTTLVDFTTMDRNLQNAYSRQASIEVERVLARGLTASVGYQYLRGDNLLMSVNQNVPTCVAQGTNNGCRPNPGYRNNSQYSSVAESTYHGLYLSLVQRPTNWASVRVSYTLSKSMNNVGEAFFSSPVDPTDIMRDWGRSDDDQRHRVVINGTVNSSMAPATTTWERISHGFQVSTFLQYYSSLPFNITSGVANLQGTNSRPLANGATAAPNFDVRAVTLIPRNAGIGSDFFSLNLRLVVHSSSPVVECFHQPFGLDATGDGECTTESKVQTEEVAPDSRVPRNQRHGPHVEVRRSSRTVGEWTAVGALQVRDAGRDVEGERRVGLQEGAHLESVTDALPGGRRRRHRRIDCSIDHHTMALIVVRSTPVAHHVGGIDWRAEERFAHVVHRLRGV